jgi:prefoldin alpha subunit
MAELNQIEEFLDDAYELQYKLQTARNTLAHLNTAVEGISMTYSVIKEIVNKSPNQEIILPLGSSAALKAKIPDPGTILIFIDKKTLVEQDAKNALENIRKKREELQRQQDKVRKQVEEFQSEYERIEPQVQQLQQIYQAQQLQKYMQPNTQSK